MGADVLALRPYDVTQDKRGFLRLEFMRGTEVTEDVAKGLIDELVLVGGNTYQLLVVTAGLKDMSAVARAVLTEIAIPPKTMAVVVGSLVDQIIAKTFLSQSRTWTSRALIFSDEDAAIEWLLGQ
jgi:hypothetical protein